MNLLIFKDISKTDNLKDQASNQQLVRNGAIRGYTFNIRKATSNRKKYYSASEEKYLAQIFINLSWVKGLDITWVRP